VTKGDWRWRECHSSACWWGGCLLANAAQALTLSIQYQLFALGGNQYRYEYTVHNEDMIGGETLTLFDLLFDPLRYDEFSLLPDSPPAITAHWTENVWLSAPGVFAAYDVAANNGGLPAGASLDGFAVQFAWWGGPDLPGPQPFEVYDPDTFDLLATGLTAPLATVAEPPVWSLLAFGGLALRWRRRRPPAL
jgi:hypothetical protein